MQNVQKMLNFKEYFSLLSLRRIFFAEIFSLQRILCLLTSIVWINEPKRGFQRKLGMPFVVRIQAIILTIWKSAIQIQWQKYA